ncbi:MAG: hypothetical protein GY875_17880 [Gammaproteobacteria bacterium]|nr:hypothetical protein [Gammaproteobacteria bacterium]
MLNPTDFPFMKTGSAPVCGRKSRRLPIVCSLLLCVVSTTVHSAADVVIQGAPAIVNSTTAFNVDIVFSEDVTGFIATDVSLGNAAVTNFTPADGANYSVEITPNGGGDISIDIAADVELDVALNGNTAAAQVNVVYDATPPSVDIQGEPATFNTTDPFDVTVEFSEPVSGFDASDVSTVNATVSNFTAVDGDTYTVEITANAPADISIDIAADVAQDATLNGNTPAVQAIVMFDNLDPIANAGPDQVVNEGSLVTLDGSASSDLPPDAIAAYAWTQTGGVAVALSDSSVEMPQFDTPFVIGETLLQFELVVTDSVGASSAVDSVTVTVGNALVVDAGVDQQVTEGDVVYLNGLNSLSLNRSIAAYLWIQLEGPVVALNDARSATASFTAPLVDVTTLLVFQLFAVDSSGALDSATTLVNVRDQGLTRTAPPLDVELLNKTVRSGAIYQFGTVGVPFGLNTSVEWTQVNGIDVTLVDANTFLPSFTAPTVLFDIPAGFEVRSTDIIDGLVVRAAVNVNIQEPLSMNLAPVAEAGADQDAATEGATVQLDATASTDGEGVIAGYLWRQTSGPGVVLSSILQARPTFVAPAIAAADSGVTLSFEVMVSDDGGFVDRDSVTVTVDDNSITEFADDKTAIVSALGNPVSISIDNGSLVSLHAIHPASIVDVINRPTNLPYGLFDFSVRVEPRSSVQVSFVLPTPASADLVWWKYTISGGWMELRSAASFNPARDVVTITLTDNGVGDDDPVLGIIRDPGGLGPMSPEENSDTVARAAESSGGSGGSVGPYLLVFLLLNTFVALYRSRRRRDPHA